MIVAAFAAFACLPSQANAARCGTSAGGFETWKREFAEEARSQGASANDAVAALMTTNYNSATIGADRGQKSFHLSLEQF